MFKLGIVILISGALLSCGGDSGPDSELKTGTEFLDSDTEQPSSPQATLAGSECIDTDGDGWGWDESGTCVAEKSIPPVSAQFDNCERLQSGAYHVTELVTDVILTAGQSNATGDATRYEPENFTKDQINTRLLAWTENNTWEIADPRTQAWHDGKYPSGRNQYQNHPAFQIGRSVADADECRVVAIIATAAAGMPIDHWRNNEDNHYQDINSTVTTALNALPGKYKVDMIWWMQGEADNDQYIDRYYGKLTDLIGMFRSETWFESNGYFLANETGWYHHANTAIRLLRTDDNTYTDYSRGQDSPEDTFPNLAIDGDIKTHFNEVSLRKIGDLVASKYLFEYLPIVNSAQ